MKKLYIIVLGAAALMMNGCDIERLPYGSYSAETIQKDKAEALDILLNGCYAQLRSATDVMHRTCRINIRLPIIICREFGVTDTKLSPRQVT